LALAPSDLPIGWTLGSPGTEGQVSLPLISQFSEIFVGSNSGFSANPLAIDISVFSTIDDAKNEYKTELTAAQAVYSTSSPNIGQEAFVDEQISGYQCFFREVNVVGEIRMSTIVYGGSLDATISFAKLQDAKIVKLAK